MLHKLTEFEGHHFLVGHKLLLYDDARHILFTLERERMGVNFEGNVLVYKETVTEKMES